MGIRQWPWCPILTKKPFSVRLRAKWCTWTTQTYTFGTKTFLCSSGFLRPCLLWTGPELPIHLPKRWAFSLLFRTKILHLLYFKTVNPFHLPLKFTHSLWLPFSFSGSTHHYLSLILSRGGGRLLSVSCLSPMPPTGSEGGMWGAQVGLCRGIVFLIYNFAFC